MGIILAGLQVYLKHALHPRHITRILRHIVASKNLKSAIHQIEVQANCIIHIRSNDI